MTGKNYIIYLKKLLINHSSYDQFQVDSNLFLKDLEFHNSNADALDIDYSKGKIYNIKFINARLFHLYGPSDKPTKFVNSIIQSLKNNLPTIDLTSGTQRRDFIYIDDAIEAFLLIILNLNIKALKKKF